MKIRPLVLKMKSDDETGLETPPSEGSENEALKSNVKDLLKDLNGKWS